MIPFLKKKYIIPIVASLFLFVGASFKNDFFEIAKQIEINGQGYYRHVE
jgi:carboxyl-terminal processing protease